MNPDKVNNVFGEERKVKVIPHRWPGIPLQQLRASQQQGLSERYILTGLSR